MLVLSWSSDRRTSSALLGRGRLGSRGERSGAPQCTPRQRFGDIAFPSRRVYKAPILSPASGEERKAVTHGLKFKMVVQLQASVHVLSTLQGGVAEL